KPGALGAEDERDPRPRARMQLAGKLRAGRSRRDRRRAELAPGCAQPQGQGGVGERRFEAVATAGGEQHVIRAAGQCDRLGMPQDSRISRRDEDETREAHDADRAGGRPDVAWMTRFDEDEIDAPRRRVRARIHDRRSDTLEWLVWTCPKPMHPMLNIAIQAARRAARIINRAALDLETIKIARKQRNDFVTEVDQAAEAAIIETLLGAYPGHAILAEESGHRPGQPPAPVEQAENIWIIDPLDGTTNFIHGMPQYAISIALAQRGVVTQG